ncbi:MAG: hypothetical protein ACREOU_08935 [Candidatus Eiseniibacteriota bacterium]
MRAAVAASAASAAPVALSIAFAVAAAGLLAGCGREHAPALRYIVRPEPDSGRVFVEAEYRTRPGRLAVFLNTMDFGGAPASRHVTDLSVTTGDDRAVSIERSGATWSALVPRDGRLKFRYALDVAALANESGAHVVSRLDTAGCLLYGGQLFVLPEPTSDAQARASRGTGERGAPLAVSIAVQTPPGWRVASSWGVERTDFAFDADSLDALADAVLAVGRYELAARRSQTFNLVVAYRGHREADAESLAALAGRLCARYEERLGASPGSLGLVVLDPATTADRTVRILSLANAVVIEGDSLALDTRDPGFRHLVAHELFHWWSGTNGVLAYRDDALRAMSEGYADYASARALLGLGAWSVADYAGFIEQRRAALARARDRDVALADLSWRAAEAATESADVDLARAKAALVAYATDRSLAAWSGGSASLAELYRALVRRGTYRPGRVFFGRREYEAAVAEVAGTAERARTLEGFEGGGLSASLDSILAADSLIARP